MDAPVFVMVAAEPLLSSLKYFNHANKPEFNRAYFFIDIIISQTYYIADLKTKPIYTID